MCIRSSHWAACALIIHLGGTMGLAQSVVLESAQLGASGRIGGTSITSAQHVGWRFQTSEPLTVERVGGHLLSYLSIPGDIFAALVRLTSLDAFPLGSPFTAEEVLATTTFRPNFPSGEIRTPLPALLSPGSYALVFGTNAFGATGEGAIHNGPDQPDIPPTDISSYIFWGVPSPSQPPQWRTNLAGNMRFIIEAQVLDLTADFNGSGIVDSVDLAQWQGAFGLGSGADADEDDDTDGADFLIWQQQLGISQALTTSSTAVPESSGLVLLILGALLLHWNRPVALSTTKCATGSASASSYDRP